MKEISNIDLLLAEKEAFINYYEEIKYDSKFSECYKNAINDKILILEVKIWKIKKGIKNE